MRASSRPRRRRAGVTIWVVLLVLPLFALVAFAVDLNYIWTTDAELQAAADASALAGANQLLQPNMVASLPNTPPSQWNSLQAQAAQNAVAAAQARAQTEKAAGSKIDLNNSDVLVGYIQDPSAAPNTAAGQWQQASSDNFPNSVQVTARLDKTVPAGPLQLNFGPMLGTPTVARRAMATATLRCQNVTGFSGKGSRLLPVAMSLSARNALLGQPSAGGGLGEGLGALLSILNLLNLLYWLFPPVPPPGVTLQDAYTVSLPIAGGSAPPANVTAGGDGVPEANVATNRTSPGDFRLVSLSNSATTGDSTYVGWILNGPTATDLATFGAQGLQASQAKPVTMYGGQSADATIQAAFPSIVGQTRIVPVFSSYTGGGSPTYQVVGFSAVVVVAVNLQAAQPYIILQPTAALDPSATLGGGSGAGNAAFVYRGVSLSR